MVLALNVLFDDIVGNVAATAAKIPTGPKMPPPVCLAQMRICAEELMRRFSFDLLYQSANCDLWWDGNEQVNMILGNVPFDDIHILPLAYLADHVPNSKSHFTFKYLFPVFRNPNQMKVDHENRMRTMPIFAHGPNPNQTALKLPPKGGGFNPPKV
jgi:hypothetical protein